MSSPDYGLGDDSPPRLSVPIRAGPHSTPETTAVPLNSTVMATSAASATQESIFIPDDDVEELETMDRQSNKVQTIHESEEEEEPVAATRQRRVLRPSTLEVTKPSPRKPTPKATRKPSSSATGSKPIMKNDMKAKKALIKEIEGYWGKQFIKTYIPRCHRPLLKRGNQGKRCYTRAHENDPKKWLPSVLKAVLMIAKLTNNKKWLSSAMTEVVRYRIKHTGNRKPQLSTTDFDVLEDMLIKNWKVDYSFGIRYKHLLVNSKDQVETDEDVDRIMRVSGSEGEGSNDDQDMSAASDSESDSDTGQQQGRGVSYGYEMMTGYHQPPSSSSRGKKHKAPKKEIVKEESPMSQQHPPPGMYGGYYGQPPTDQWGRPMMMPPHGYGGYGGFGGYDVYPPYGPPQIPSGSRQPSHQPYPQGMYTPRQPPMNSSSRTPRLERSGRDSPKIKRESPGAEEDQINNFGNPGFIGHQGAMIDDPAVDEEEEDIDAEVAAAEAELKLARLRAKRARMARK